MKLVAIDFETANNENTSAVSVGIAFRENGVIHSKEWLIRPPSGTKFEEDYHIKVHGITPEMVERERAFPEVWREIEQFVGDVDMFVAHNSASAEQRQLNGLFQYYEMGAFPYFVLCSMRQANSTFCQWLKSPELQGLEIPKIKCGLGNVSQLFGINLENHHSAESDAVACLEIMEILQDGKKLQSKFQAFVDKNIAICEQKKNFLSSLKPRCQFEGKNFLLTLDVYLGDILLERDEVKQFIQKFGGTVKSSYSSKVHFVVAGKDDEKDLWQIYTQWRSMPDCAERDCLFQSMTGKMKDAICRQHEEKIISCETFLQMLQSEPELGQNNETAQIRIVW